MLPLEGKALAGPGLAQQFHPFLETPDTDSLLDPEGAEIGLLIAKPDAECESAAGHDIERDRVFRNA